MRSHFLNISVIMLSVAVMLFSAPACRRMSEADLTDEIHIGYMICNSLDETKDRFEPLTAFLEDVLRRKIVSHYINTYQFTEEMEKGYLQVAHTNSLLYVIFHEDYNWRLLAGEKEGSHGSYTAGAVIVPYGSPLMKLADLKGKRVIFGPELAPMGFLSQYYLMMEHGLDPELDLGYYAFARGAFSHEKVVYAVLYGEYDAGSVPLLDLENMEREGKIRGEDYRIIAMGDLVPYCTFSTAPGLSEDTRLALENALLGLTKDVTARVDGEVLRVLERAGVEGFELLKDSDYDQIRNMARKANMPPYQKF